MRRYVFLLAFSMLLFACGSDDDTDVSVGADGETPAGETGDGGDGDDGDGEGGTAGDGGECPDTLFVGEIVRQEGGDSVHVAASASGEDIVDAVAWGSFGSYTVYLADHDIDTSPFEDWDRGNFGGDSAVVADDGGLLVTIFLNPPDSRVEAGTVIDYADYFGTPIIDTGGGAQMAGGDGDGRVTILAVDDDRICFEIDFEGSNQTVAGTVSARIHGS
jgi:hypothetical protein